MQAHSLICTPYLAISSGNGRSKFTFSASYFAEVAPKCDASNKNQCGSSTIGQTACEAKGCCWTSSGSPNCFYLPGMLDSNFISIRSAVVVTEVILLHFRVRPFCVMVSSSFWNPKVHRINVRQ